MVRNAAQSTSKPAWHRVFVEMLPAIRTHAKIAFRHLDREAREEAVQEVACNACCAVARLAQLGKLDLAYPSALARFGVAQVNDGRKVGCKLNIRDVLSSHCQRRKKVVVERLDYYDADEDAWREILIEDRHAGPAETAAARIDIGLWFATLPRKKRRIAETLATGLTTKAAARKFRLTAGRISQLRREFMDAWSEYQGEPAFA